MSMQQITEPAILQVPREALDIDFQHDSVVIEWQSEEDWEFLKYARAYVKANPEDVCSYMIYKNLLSAYRSGR